MEIWSQKRMMHKSVYLLLTATSAFSLASQTPPIFPQLSPSASVSQTIGTTTVEVHSHRPAVRGRQIFGSLVPYGQVWR